MKFQPSDKVVCIRGLPENLWKSYLEGFINVGPLPETGRVYVVLKVGLALHQDGIALVGSTSMNFVGMELGFCEEHFRKLEDIQAENQAAMIKEATRLINTDPDSL